MWSENIFVSLYLVRKYTKNLNEARVFVANGQKYIKEKYKLKIFACHVNHMIRGEESDSDEQFVRSLCSQLGIELFVRKTDVPDIANKA